MKPATASSIFLLTLSACAAKLPPPAVELQIQRVEIPVATPCLSADKIPAEPEHVASNLTGDAVHDLDLVTASALRLRNWGAQMHAALEACAR